MLPVSNLPTYNNQIDWQPCRTHEDGKSNEISSTHKCNSTLIMNRPDNSLLYRSPKNINGNKLLGLIEKLSLGRIYIASLASQAIPLKNRSVKFFTDFKPDSFLSEDINTLTIIGHRANHKQYKEAMAKLSTPEKLSVDEEEYLNHEVSQ